ncbi:glutamyl-tRNA reductase [Microvenator marinus]|jgi:glutamyl-tRNA reductase|uniref:Glutamyl-tRNA reductase n=1 Tax=Microvenator marinus TaxID=2600177 RepID=A0A5B8XL72_9DELT|nr:glutamyl-tRNA reductase [Microvenator marinus]QED25827.1 glutamyl-tRNA reductase [Microvenator marinus]
MTKTPEISLFSFSHRNTSLELRDALAFSREETESFIPKVRDELRSEVAVLSTCNRTEFYLFGAPEDLDWQGFSDFVTQTKAVLGGEAVCPIHYRGQEAARHLFRVAASIESLALGEDQILSQVKDTHRQLLEIAGKSPILDRLYQYAIRAGKRVRTETSLCDGAVSISSAAVELTKRIFGDFKEAEVLLVGAGETAEGAAEHFKAAGASRFAVANRGEPRGQALAKRFGGAYKPLSDLESALKTADIALFATGSTSVLLDPAMIKRVMKARSYKSLTLLDISNPRNVDSKVSDESGVFLFNIDDLEQVVRENLRERQKEIPRAEAIIEEVLREWEAWMHTMQVMPTIGEMARFFESLRVQELEKHQGRTSDENYAAMDAFSKALVKKLMHNPISYLRGGVEKQTLRPEDIAVLRDAFGLGKDE